MPESSPLHETIRRRVGGLLLLEQRLHTYRAQLQAAQAAELAQIPADLRARLDARAAMIADITRLLEASTDHGE
jgi:hypothetical protein